MPGGPSPTGRRPALLSRLSGGCPGPLPRLHNMLIDSHCHLTDDQFQDDRWEVLARAHQAGVGGVISISSDARDTGRILSLLEEGRGKEGIPRLWGTSGIHPHEAEKAKTGDLDTVAQVAREEAQVVAVGETGLDFFYDHSPRDVQEGLFRKQLELAESLSLPVVVHSRSADDLTAEILKGWGGRVQGVLHCFTGGEALLRTALRVGWMISFTGIITFKKYDGRDLLRSIPRERLMVETDGPYLAPVPHRGKRNEPSFVPYVAEALAQIRGEDLEEVQGYTTENAARFFGLDF
jgi:TatD DNase family protein